MVDSSPIFEAKVSCFGWPYKDIGFFKSGSHQCYGALLWHHPVDELEILYWPGVAFTLEWRVVHSNAFSIFNCHTEILFLSIIFLHELFSIVYTAHSSVLNCGHAAIIWKMSFIWSCHFHALTQGGGRNVFQFCGTFYALIWAMFTIQISSFS